MVQMATYAASAITSSNENDQGQLIQLSQHAHRPQPLKQTFPNKRNTPETAPPAAYDQCL
jgi:hypothetical protein